MNAGSAQAQRGAAQQKAASEAYLANQAAQPLNTGRLVFHSGVAAVMLGAYVGLRGYMDKLALPEQFGGDLQYLTILGMICTTVTMVLSAAGDLVPGDVVLVSLKRLLTMIALPLEIIIAAIYWPLVLFKPSLMLQPKPGTRGAELLYIPVWIDLGLHLVPAVAMVIDFFAFEERYHPPTSTRLAAVLALFITTLYAVWLEYCAHWNERFPYPFLELVDVDERVWIYLAASVIAFAIFSILNALHK